MIKQHRIDIIASLCCLGFVACWTIGALQIEFLTDKVDLWTQNFGRYGAACLFWMPFLIYNLRRGAVPRRVWTAAGWVFGANLVMQTCWGGSFYFADPAFVTLLNKTSVIWVASFSLMFFVDERRLVKSVFFWIGLGCSLAGVAGVIAFQRDFAWQASLGAAALPIASSVTWAIYSILAKVKFKQIDSRISFAVMTIYMTVGLGLLALVFGRPSRLLEMNAPGWATLISSGIIAIALGHVLYYIAIHRIGATIPAMTLLATPLTTTIASYIVYGETLTTGQITFGAVLLTGAAAAILAQRDLQQKSGPQQ